MPKPDNLIPYRSDLRAKARELRKNGTRGEAMLWTQLKGRKTGCEFHRQYPLGLFIVDFYCPEIRLAVELDGSSHDHEDVYKYDVRRQQWLEGQGIQVARFRETDVLTNIEGVFKTVCERVNERMAEECGLD